MKPYQLLFVPALAAATLGTAAPGTSPGSAPTALAWAAPAPVSSGVGDALPAPELSDFMQTDAESFDDYKGRAVLIEFFEHW